MKAKTIEKVRKSMQAQSIENCYKNLVCLSGWILDKPRVITHDTLGRESVSFIIAQFNRDRNGFSYMKTYHLLSYAKSVVNIIKELTSISFIICDCQLQYNNKTKRFYPHVYDLKVESILPLELDQESENENGEQERFEIENTK